MREKVNLNNSSMPLVSIVIPVYNGSNYLNQAINSALAQTYPNIEVIVVNDGSTDNNKTAAVAKAYGQRIRYFEKENGGVASALNFGITQMRGEYFSWLSHDDMYTPEKISMQMESIRENGQGVVSCNVLVVGPDGTIMKKNVLASRKKVSIKCFLALDSETGLNGCSLLIPKEAFQLCGNFKENLECTQDYDLWFRIADKFRFFFVEKFGVLSRQHDMQDSKTKTNICTEEADKLHSMFLSKISTNEMKKFVGSNLSYLDHQYTVYFNAGYLKTSAQIFLHLWKLEHFEGFSSDYSEKILLKTCEIKQETWLPKIQKYILKALTSHVAKPTLMFYSNVWTKGGIERVLSILIPEFIDEFSVVLVSNYIENEEGFSLPSEVLHIKIDSQLNERLPYALLVLALLCNTNIFIGNPNIIYSFLDVYKLLEESNIRTIASNHGYYFIPYWSKWIYPVAAKRKEVYPIASVVTWLTSFSTALGKNLSNNSVLMPNPNTFPSQSPKKNIGKNKNILVVGRFYDHIKRIDRALQVFRKIIIEHPDAKLYLVGGYDLEMHVPTEAPYTIKQLIDYLEFPFPDSIIWVGETEDVTTYYNLASVLLLTSDNEGFPMVLNEAGVFGVPQVIFNIPGLEDIVSDGENGFIVSQDDIQGMADKVNILLSDINLLTKMSLKAQEMAERFDKRKIAFQWKNLFKKLLALPQVTSLETNEVPQASFQTLKDLQRSVVLYESQISEITSPQFQLSPRQAIYNISNPVIHPCNRCLEEIYNSTSWKVTKPLRWGAMTYRSLKNNGLFITMQKIYQRFKWKFLKEHQTNE